MQPFTCPECNFHSSFDPLKGSAVCPRCGYTPPLDRRVVAEPVASPERRPHASLAGALSLLDELLSHWEETHIPNRGIVVSTKSEALAVFRLYQQALGETRQPGADRHVAYTRSYKPEKGAILSFVAAYLLLKQGERARAAQMLRSLTQRYPSFPDPWVWLSATTKDPTQRQDFLENAVILEPAHPLAREALAIAQGKVSAERCGAKPVLQPQVLVAKCPKCGGGLRYEPGADAAECPFCGELLAFEQVNVVDGEAPLVGDLRLRRRLQGHVWKEARRVLRCHACGAVLAMSGHLAKECLFCDSTHVLTEDSERTLEQPDGFLPFRLDEAQAQSAAQKAQRSTMGRLKTWWIGEEMEIHGLSGVYLPFWVFDGFVEVRKPRSLPPAVDASTGQSVWEGTFTSSLSGSAASWGVGSTKHRHAQERAIPRKDLMVFDNLVFSAIDFPPWWLLKQVLPFSLEAVVPYEPRLLADWPAVLYRLDVEDVVQQAYNTMLAKAVWRNKFLVFAQAADAAELRRAFQVTSVSYQLVLLPVWVGLAGREKKHHLVLVNGQTGQVVVSNPLRASGES